MSIHFSFSAPRFFEINFILFLTPYEVNINMYTLCDTHLMFHFDPLLSTKDISRILKLMNEGR